eukprot:403358254
MRSNSQNLTRSHSQNLNLNLKNQQLPQFIDSSRFDSNKENECQNQTRSKMIISNQMSLKQKRDHNLNQVSQNNLKFQGDNLKNKVNKDHTSSQSKQSTSRNMGSSQINTNRIMEIQESPNNQTHSQENYGSQVKSPIIIEKLKSKYQDKLAYNFPSDLFTNTPQTYKKQSQIKEGQIGNNLQQQNHQLVETSKKLYYDYKDQSNQQQYQIQQNYQDLNEDDDDISISIEFISKNGDDTDLENSNKSSIAKRFEEAGNKQLENQQNQYQNYSIHNKSTTSYVNIGDTTDISPIPERLPSFIESQIGRSIVKQNPLLQSYSNNTPEPLNQRLTYYHQQKQKQLNDNRQGIIQHNILTLQNNLNNLTSFDYPSFCNNTLLIEQTNEKQKLQQYLGQNYQEGFNNDNEETFYLENLKNPCIINSQVNQQNNFTYQTSTKSQNRQFQTINIFDKQNSSQQLKQEESQSSQKINPYKRKQSLGKLENQGETQQQINQQISEDSTFKLDQKFTSSDQLVDCNAFEKKRMTLDIKAMNEDLGDNQITFQRQDQIQANTVNSASYRELINQNTLQTAQTIKLSDIIQKYQYHPPQFNNQEQFDQTLRQNQACGSQFQQSQPSNLDKERFYEKQVFEEFKKSRKFSDCELDEFLNQRECKKEQDTSSKSVCRPYQNPYKINNNQILAQENIECQNISKLKDNKSKKEELSNRQQSLERRSARGAKSIKKMNKLTSSSFVDRRNTIDHKTYSIQDTNNELNSDQREQDLQQNSKLCKLQEKMKKCININTRDDKIGSQNLHQEFKQPTTMLSQYKPKNLNATYNNNIPFSTRPQSNRQNNSSTQNQNALSYQVSGRSSKLTIFESSRNSVQTAQINTNTSQSSGLNSNRAKSKLLKHLETYSQISSTISGQNNLNQNVNNSVQVIQRQKQQKDLYLQREKLMQTIMNQTLTSGTLNS